MTEYAFPQAVRRTEKYMDEAGRGRERIVIVNSGGLTLRDYFAAKAMQSLVHASQTMNHVTTGMVAEEAYIYADAMLEARK